MKKLFTLSFLVFFSFNLQAQFTSYYINFETADYTFSDRLIKFDAKTTNKWKVGVPLKTVFTAAYSGNRALVTDLTQPCAPNDTSIFTIEITNVLIQGPKLLTLDGISYWQSLNIGSGDLVQVEEKAFGGQWDTIRVDTPTTGWTHVSHGIQYSLGTLAPTIFRFTFITDGSIAARDGWMIDSFEVKYVEHAGIDDITQSPFRIFPNPASETINIHHSLLSAEKIDIVLYNALGQAVKHGSIPANMNVATIDVSQLPEGIYIGTLQGKEHKTIQRFIIKR